MMNTIVKGATNFAVKEAQQKAAAIEAVIVAKKGVVAAMIGLKGTYFHCFLKTCSLSVTKFYRSHLFADPNLKNSKNFQKSCPKHPYILNAYPLISS